MRIFFLVSLFFGLYSPFSQSQHNNRTGYSDFVINGSSAWLLTRAGGLEQADLRTMQSTVIAPPPSPRLAAIAKDTASNLVVADSAGQIWRRDNQTRQWVKTATCPYASPYALSINRRNQSLIVHSFGIWTSDTLGNHFPDDSLLLNKDVRGGMRTTREWAEKPVLLLDWEDRLWLGFDYGEWGGLLFAFDTYRQQFVQPQSGDFDLAFNPIVSITQAGHDLYLAGSMRHMFTHSCIARVMNLTATTVFTSESCWDRTAREEAFLVQGQSISLLAFNPGDNYLYACIDGTIVKTNAINQSAHIDRWIQVIPDSIATDDVLVKMAFAPNGQLILLYRHKGLALFNGKGLRFIKPSNQSKDR